MKEGFDREMDSLLRRHARGTAELRLWGDGAGDGTLGAHLDADELGAFAEGALPAAARGAAVSHLADCERCRGVVVGLARVAGAGVEVKPQAVAVPASTESARPSAWRAFVASLFAPRVMRLAVPVLALSLVGVVSYVALRSDKGGALQMAREGRSRPNVAMNESAAPAAAPTSDAKTSDAGTVEPTDNVARRVAQEANTSSTHRGHGGAEGQPAESDATREDAPSAAAQPPPPPPATAPAESPAVLSKAGPRPVATEEGETARTENKEKSENRDRDREKEKSSRASEPADEVAANDANVQRRGQQSRANEVQMPDGGNSRAQKRAGTDNNTSSGFGNVGGAGAAPPRESDSARPGSRSETAGRPRAPKQAEQKADDDERAPQTRTAAGHRFRRDGNAWVDVNYKSSMPSTGVRRGTEDFRALVAKVPDVGRVAEIIGGAFTVVVNGHAYSIR
jgi:hypothetical protein